VDGRAPVVGFAARSSSHAHPAHTATPGGVWSPHREQAFEAARYCIDTLKETAPIWKQEHWQDGSDWAHGQHAIRPVGEPMTAAAAPRET